MVLSHFEGDLFVYLEESGNAVYTEYKREKGILYFRSLDEKELETAEYREDGTCSLEGANYDSESEMIDSLLEEQAWELVED